MHISPFILLPLIQGAFAFTSFQIPRLCADSSTLGNSTTVSFTFADTNTNLTAECTSTFPPESKKNVTYPTRYNGCGNDTDFAWRFGAFDGIERFELDLLRRFKDPDVGDPPFDVVTLFGTLNVTQGPDYRCNATAWAERCRNPRGTALKVRLNAVIAKK